MTKRCLLSHAHFDKEIAQQLAHVVQRVSLQGVSVWYSSDESGVGGIGAGERWLDTIRSRLAESQAVIALLTPRSKNRPWIYFESGFGAAKADLEVIPVSVGLNDMNAIPMPLAMYQAFQISDTRSLAKFLQKLLAKFEITFDSEMAAAPIRECVAKITALRSELGPEHDDTTAETDLQMVKMHFDRRFFELLSKLDPSDTVSTYSVIIILTSLNLRRSRTFQ